MDEFIRSLDIKKWIDIKNDLCEPKYSEGDKAPIFEIPNDAFSGNGYKYSEELHFVRLFGEITIGYVDYKKRNSIKDKHKVIFRGVNKSNEEVEVVTPGSGGDPEKDIEVLGLVKNLLRP